MKKVEFIQFKRKLSFGNEYYEYVTNYKVLIFKPWNKYIYYFSKLRKKCNIN